VWVEGDRPDGFRARIIRIVDGEQQPPTAADQTVDVFLALRTWLDELLEQER
jgi:hypothetical protein